MLISFLYDLRTCKSCDRGPSEFISRDRYKICAHRFSLCVISASFPVFSFPFFEIHPIFLSPPSIISFLLFLPSQGVLSRFLTLGHVYLMTTAGSCSVSAQLSIIRAINWCLDVVPPTESSIFLDGITHEGIDGSRR